MRTLLLFTLPLFLLIQQHGLGQINRPNSEKDIDDQLEAWHQAATDADFGAYFGLMAEDAIFIGTDAGENWNIAEFKAFSKPYFDAGKAWSFTTLERNIYVAEGGKIAWFDELLDTWMGICRGSGVIALAPDGSWKIKHYVLSFTIPNENTTPVIATNKAHDSLLIKELRAEN